MLVLIQLLLPRDKFSASPVGQSPFDAHIMLTIPAPSNLPSKSHIHRNDAVPNHALPPDSIVQSRCDDDETARDLQSSLRAIPRGRSFCVAEWSEGRIWAKPESIYPLTGL
ncbi:hypothetical protein VTO42DRAFT_7597 [Malbranchea cinnamomea]